MTEARVSPCTRNRFPGILVPQVLVGMQGIIICAIVCTRLFLANFLADQSGTMSTVGLYYLILFLFLGLTFVVIGRSCKERSFLPFFRFSLLIHAVFFLALGFFRDDLVSLVILVAAIYGVAQGLFFLPFVQYAMEFSKPKRRARFFAALNLVGQCVAVILPPVCGWLIDKGGGHSVVFFGLSGVMVVGFFMSTFLLTGSKGPRGHYDVTGFLKCISEHPELRRFYGGIFLMGLTLWGAMELLGPLLVYRATGSALALGVVAGLLPFVEMGSSFAATKIKSVGLKRILIISGVLIFPSTVVTACVPTLGGVLVYAVMFSLLTPAVSVVVNTQGANLTSRFEAITERRTEFIVVREVCISLGRAVGYGAMFLLLRGDPSSAIPIVVISFGVLTLGAMAFFSRIEYGE